MRTSLDLDDKLMRQAMRASGAKTKKATIETALWLLIRNWDPDGFRKLRGKIDWEGDLEESRK